MADTAKPFDWRAHVFPKRDNLPADLTTFDYLKAAAIILTIIDHVGWLLFPDVGWLRVLGRLCVPLWFFLIGYANTREIPGRWFVATFILFLMRMIVGLQPIPLCILMTMALIRVTIDPLWRWLARRTEYFWWVILLLVFFTIPTGGMYFNETMHLPGFVEYGTMGMVLALAGYVVRHRPEIEEQFDAGFDRKVMIVGLTAFGILSAMAFKFDILHSITLAAGLLGVYFILIDFEGKTLPGTAGNAQAPLVRFLGRYTLEIYVLHLLILMAVFGLDRLAASIL